MKKNDYIRKLKSDIISLLEQKDDKKFPYVSLALGAIKSLENIPEGLWDNNLQFTSDYDSLKKVIFSEVNLEWEYCYHLNNANSRVDAMRDRLEGFYKDNFHIEKNELLRKSETIDGKPIIKGVFTQIISIENVFDDVRSFKHLEYVEPKSNKISLFECRQSTPQNTAIALEEILKLYRNREYYDTLKNG